MPKESFGKQVLIALARDPARSSPVMSDYPTKEGIIGFVREVQKDGTNIQSTVANVLADEIATSPTTRRRIKLGVARNIRLLPTALAMPSWMQRSGLIQMTSELTSPSVWENLIPGSSLAKKIDEGTERKDDTRTEDIARQISESNAGFATSALTLGLLAAAIGPSVKYTFRNRYIAPIKGDFVVSIGNRYPGRAKTPDEFIERVRELIPNPDTEDPRAEGTLIHALIAHEVFGSSKRRCPAIPFVRSMLEQWGRQLDTDEAYRERLKQTLTKEGKKLPTEN